MSKIIKVDRVASVQEALELQKLNVDIIGVTLNENNLYSDNRVLDFESALSIGKKLDSSKLSLELPSNGYKDILKNVEMSKVSYIQVPQNVKLTIEEIEFLSKKNIGVIYSGIEASYEDDPAWILSQYTSSQNSDVSFYQIDLLSDMENAWEFLKNESPLYPNELQINDILSLGNMYPLIISLDFNKENINEIIHNFSSVKGFVFVLSEKSNRDDIHFFSYSFVSRILDKR